MKLSFIVKFAISTALTFASTVYQSSKATPEQKAAAARLISAGEDFVLAF